MSFVACPLSSCWVSVSTASLPSFAHARICPLEFGNSLTSPLLLSLSCRRPGSFQLCLRQAALAKLSFVYLNLDDPVSALSCAAQVLALPNCQEPWRCVAPYQGCFPNNHWPAWLM